MSEKTWPAWEIGMLVNEHRRSVAAELAEIYISEPRAWTIDINSLIALEHAGYTFNFETGEVSRDGSDNG